MLFFHKSLSIDSIILYKKEEIVIQRLVMIQPEWQKLVDNMNKEKKIKCRVRNTLDFQRNE